jgi:hypothetical protein
MNSAIRLRNLLTDVFALANNGITVASALARVTNGSSLPNVVGHVIFLKKQIRYALESNPKISSLDAYLSWEQHVERLVSLPSLTHPVEHARSEFFGTPSVVDVLAMCADQIDDFEPQELLESEVAELQDAVSALHSAIVSTSNLDPSSRKTLLRICRLLLDAIQNYRFEGAVGMRAGIEQFFGASAIHSNVFDELVTKNPEKKAVVTSLFQKVVSYAEKVKPVAEAACKISELAEKFGKYLPANPAP